jgi:hypothetical protein
MHAARLNAEPAGKGSAMSMSNPRSDLDRRADLRSVA